MAEKTHRRHLANSPLKRPATVVFGFEEFWPTVYEQYGQQFDAIAELMHLGDEMVKAADETGGEPVEKVITALTRASVTAVQEVIVLCGNGCGAGAMKVVRGMYESRWTAEYLRRQPQQVEDYLEFSKILAWRKLHWLQENARSEASRITAEDAKRVEDDYNQGKARFTGPDGRVRTRWSKQSIRDIAKAIGREKQYEVNYAIACSIHHGNIEGLLTNFAPGDGTLVPDPPPSLALVSQALRCAHANVWFALNTLNEACRLDFADKVNAAQVHFSEAWKEQRASDGRNPEPTRRD